MCGLPAGVSRLAGKASVDLREMADEPFAMFSRGAHRAVGAAVAMVANGCGNRTGAIRYHDE